MFKAVAVLVLVFGSAAAAAGPPKLLVSNLTAQGVALDVAAGLTDAVVQALQEGRLFQVLSSRDLAAILSAERQRQILGSCENDSSSCAVLGGELGARFVLTGSVSQLGDTYQLSLQVLDTVKGQRLGQSQRLSRDLGVLRAQVPYAAAEATGSPLPPPAPRLAQYALIAGGSGAFIGGGFLGMQALARANVVNDDLCPGGPLDSNSDGRPDTCQGSNLRSREYYLQEEKSLGQQKTAALLLMVAGVGLAAAGLYFMPPPEGGPRVAVVPSAQGFALVGSFP